MTRHVVCKVHELPPGQRRIVTIAGRSIGVFNIAGVYHAIRNVCPHQLAPLCLGKITGTTAPAPPGEYNWVAAGTIIRCPWHGWEFDITTGRSIVDPARLRVRNYQVSVEPAACAGNCPGPANASVETYRVAVEDSDIVLHI